jgi:hypothetical protein
MASEKEMLKALLADERLNDEEREAFSSMISPLELSPRSKLTEKQRAWVVSRYEKLDLGAESSLNLHSSGKIPEKPAGMKSTTLLPWEKPGYQKVLSPPVKKRIPNH